MHTQTRVLVRASATVAALGLLVLGPASGAAPSHTHQPSQASAATAPCTPFELPAPKGWDGQATTMNDAGILVGTVVDTDGVEHPAYWTPNGRSAADGYVLHQPDVPAAGEFLDVNDAGTAVAFDDSTGQGFVYDTGTGAFRFLPDYAGGYNDRPRRINAHGVIAGVAIDADGNGFATTWSGSYGTARRVHAPGEEQQVRWVDPVDGTVYVYTNGSEADGIDDDGNLAVITNIPAPRLRHSGRHYWFTHDLGSDEPIDAADDPVKPVVKTSSGRFQVLSSDTGEAYTFALATTGLVVGDNVDVDTPDSWITRPVYWKGGSEHDLGMPADAADGRALNIDDTWVTGYVDYPDGTTRGWVWTGGGLLQILPNLPGYDRGSYSHGVNSRLRQFSGTALAAGSDRHVGVVWQCPGSFSTQEG